MINLFKKISLAVILLMISVFSSSAQAGDYQLAIHTGSAHFESGYNGKNPGLGVRVKDGEETYYQVGGYYNSVKRTTLYAIYGYEPLKVGNVTFGGFVGLTSGYGVTVTETAIMNCSPTGDLCSVAITEHLESNKKITPAAGLTAAIAFEKFNVMIIAVPTVKYQKVKHAGSISLSFMVPF